MTASPNSVDDASHSVLSKARPIQQTEISAFREEQEARSPASRLPPRTYGSCTVQEVEVASALTDMTLFGEQTWSLNPYTGCTHDCAYCYVPDVAHVERGPWGGYVVVKRNLPRVLSRELKQETPRRVFLSSATDPYQPAEARHRVTRRCLELLAREGWPVRVLTRNPLIQRDIELLKCFPDVEVGLSIPTLDDDARATVEPSAPQIQARLDTVEALDEAGLDPFVNLAPAYPLTGDRRPDEIAQTFANAGASTVYAGRWRYLGNVLPALEDRVDDTTYEIFTRAVDDERYYDRMFTSLAGAFRRAGVPFEEMGSR